MTVTDHPHVAAYLARFDALSQHLPPERRAELRADLLEHLADAIPADADDAAVRAALDRLGPPEDIVSAEQGPAAAVVAPPRSPRLVHEGLAVALLTAGSFIPVLGWVVGVTLLWTSGRWTPKEKLAGTLLVPGGPAAVLFVFGLGAFTTAGAEVCSTADATAATPDGTPVPDPVVTCTGGGGGGGVGILLLILVVAAFVAPFVVGAVLFRRAARRARAA